MSSAFAPFDGDAEALQRVGLMPPADVWMVGFDERHVGAIGDGVAGLGGRLAVDANTAGQDEGATRLARGDQAAHRPAGARPDARRRCKSNGRAPSYWNGQRHSATRPRLAPAQGPARVKRRSAAVRRHPAASRLDIVEAVQGRVGRACRPLSSSPAVLPSPRCSFFDVEVHRRSETRGQPPRRTRPRRPPAPRPLPGHGAGHSGSADERAGCCRRPCRIGRPPASSLAGGPARAAPVRAAGQSPPPTVRHAARVAMTASVRTPSRQRRRESSPPASRASSANASVSRPSPQGARQAVAVDHVKGRPPAPSIVVHRRKVVVDQRVGVDRPTAQAAGDAGRVAATRAASPSASAAASAAANVGIGRTLFPPARRL